MKRQDTVKSSIENKLENKASRKESSLEPKSKEKISIIQDGGELVGYQKKNSLPKNH